MKDNKVLKKTKYLLISLLLIVFLSSNLIVSAESYLPHKQNTDLEFSIGSNFATECILETLNSPHGVNTINLQGTKIDKSFKFRISGSNYSSLGTYCHIISCSDGVNSVTNEECREITPSGEVTNGWKISLQLFTSVSCLVLMGLFLFLSMSGMKAKQLQGDEKPVIRFFFTGLALVFLVAHILITNVILQNTLGSGLIADSYTKVMWGFFTILITIFIYILFKVSIYEIDVFKRRAGLR